MSSHGEYPGQISAAFEFLDYARSIEVPFPGCEGGEHSPRSLNPQELKCHEVAIAAILRYICREDEYSDWEEDLLLDEAARQYAQRATTPAKTRRTRRAPGRNEDPQNLQGPAAPGEE